MNLLSKSETSSGVKKQVTGKSIGWRGRNYSGLRAWVELAFGICVYLIKLFWHGA
jgi:hypothetical protein